MTEISLKAGVPKLIELDAPYNVKKYSNAVAVYIGESPLQCKYPLELDDQTILTQDFYAKADNDTTITLTATFSPDIAARLDWMQIKIDENTDGRALLVARVTQNEQDILALQGGQQALVTSISTLNSEQTVQDQKIATNESSISDLNSEQTIQDQNIAANASDIEDLNQDIQNLGASVRYASQAEVNAGTVDSKVISPLTLGSFWNTNYQYHTNKVILDKFGQDNNGKPTYNGNTIDTTIAQRDVYNGFDSSDTTISASANTARVLNSYITSLNVRTANLENNTSYATTTKAGIVERATDAEVNNGTDTTRYITPKQLKTATSAVTIPDATTTVAGKVERATDSEAAAGNDNVRYITPKQLGIATDISAIPYATTTLAGRVEKATTAEVLAGNDTTRYVTPADLTAFSQALPSTSGGITIGQGVTILSDANETDRPKHLETVGDTLSLGNGAPSYSELDIVALSDSIVHIDTTLYYNGSTTNISDPTIRYWIVPLNTEVSGSATGTSIGSGFSGQISADITIPAGHYCHIDGTTKDDFQNVHRAEINATTIELTSTAGSTAISIPSAQGAYITYGADGNGTTVQVTEPIYLSTQGDSASLDVGSAVGNSVRWVSALAVSNSTINIHAHTGSAISFVENNAILSGLKYWVVPLGGTITNSNYTGLISNSASSTLGGGVYEKNIFVPSGSMLYFSGDNAIIDSAILVLETV